MDIESTLALVDRAKSGDREAIDQLVQRYLPRLRRWARGRLPHWARDLAETQDLVQESMVRAFQRMGEFTVRGEGALQAYLRQSVLNRIRDEIRRAGRRPPHDTLEPGPDIEDPAASPLETVIGHEAAERYERALARLSPQDREAIIARVELGCTAEELAAVLGKPSPNAARMAVERALVRLAAEMRKQHE